jgi:hypothetical protein
VGTGFRKKIMRQQSRGLMDFTAAAAYNAFITGSLGGSPHARLARYLMRD